MKITFLCAVAVIFVALSPRPSVAQDTSQVPSIADLAKASRAQKARKTSAILNRMDNADRAVRAKALQDLCSLIFEGENRDVSGFGDALGNYFARYPEQADAVRLGLIQLLATENKREQDIIAANQNSPSIPTSEAAGAKNENEEEDEFYPEVIGMVAALNDERAIPVLLGAITTGGMATKGVARFGDKAVDPLLALYSTSSSPHSVVKSSVLFAIRDMLMMRVPIAERSHARIKTTLGSALKDPEFGVRYSALCAIEYLDEREDLVPALKEIAAHDVGLKTSANEYTLKPTAENLLRKIANHERPPAF